MAVAARLAEPAAPTAASASCEPGRALLAARAPAPSAGSMTTGRPPPRHRSRNAPADDARPAGAASAEMRLRPSTTTGVTPGGVCSRWTSTMTRYRNKRLSLRCSSGMVNVMATLQFVVLEHAVQFADAQRRAGERHHDLSGAGSSSDIARPGRRAASPGRESARCRASPDRGCGRTARPGTPGSERRPTRACDRSSAPDGFAACGSARSRERPSLMRRSVVRHPCQARRCSCWLSRLLSRAARRRDRFSRGTGSSRPPTASEMRPVSSLTTSRTASVSSLMHRAERWRMPMCMLAPSGGWPSGNWHAAAAMRPPHRITAPSCSGLRLLKIARSRLADTSAVDRFARLDVHGQGHLALDDDESADAFARHRLGGVGQLVGDRMLRRRARSNAGCDSGPAPSGRAAVPAGK